MQVTGEMLSTWQKDAFNNENKIHSSPPKLMQNLCNKRDYIIHYRNLQQYLSLRMQLKKVIVIAVLIFHYYHYYYCYYH